MEARGNPLMTIMRECSVVNAGWRVLCVPATMEKAKIPCHLNFPPIINKRSPSLSHFFLYIHASTFDFNRIIFRYSIVRIENKQRSPNIHLQGQVSSTLRPAAPNALSILIAPPPPDSIKTFLESTRTHCAARVAFGFNHATQ